MTNFKRNMDNVTEIDNVEATRPVDVMSSVYMYGYDIPAATTRLLDQGTASQMQVLIVEGRTPRKPADAPEAPDYSDRRVGMKAMGFSDEEADL